MSGKKKLILILWHMTHVPICLSIYSLLILYYLFLNLDLLLNVQSLLLLLLHLNLDSLLLFDSINWDSLSQSWFFPIFFEYIFSIPSFWWDQFYFFSSWLLIFLLLIILLPLNIVNIKDIPIGYHIVIHSILHHGYELFCILIIKSNLIRKSFIESQRVYVFIIKKWLVT